MKPLSRQGSQIGLAGQGSTQAADGVFDAALLPGGVRVAEEGLDAEGMEVVMAGELRAIVEGDGLAAVGGQGGEEAGEGLSDRGGGLAGGPDGEEEAGGAFMEGEDGLAVSAEEHEVSFPVAGGLAVGGGRGAGGERAAVRDQGGGAAAAGAAAAFALGLGQVVAPRIGLGAGDLSVQEAVDGLRSEDGAAGLPGPASGDLLGRPALLEMSQDGGA